jgi:hypothetical protein
VPLLLWRARPLADQHRSSRRLLVRLLVRRRLLGVALLLRQVPLLLWRASLLADRHRSSRRRLVRLPVRRRLLEVALLLRQVRLLLWRARPLADRHRSSRRRLVRLLVRRRLLEVALLLRDPLFLLLLFVCFLVHYSAAVTVASLVGFLSRSGIQNEMKAKSALIMSRAPWERLKRDERSRTLLTALRFIIFSFSLVYRCYSRIAGLQERECR